MSLSDDDKLLSCDYDISFETVAKIGITTENKILLLSIWRILNDLDWYTRTVYCCWVNFVWKKREQHTLGSNYNNLALVAWKSVPSSEASIGPQNMPLFVQVSHYSAQNPVHSILLCRPFKLIFLGVYSRDRWRLFKLFYCQCFDAIVAGR